MSSSEMEKGIKIVSDGTPYGTRVIDLNTGEPIPRIRSISIDIEAGREPVVAVLEVYVEDLEITIPTQKKALPTIELRYESTKGDERG